MIVLMNTIKAIIYDVDGTMVNSEPLHVSAWDETLHEYGFALDDLSQNFRATMAGKKPIVIAEGMVKELAIEVQPEYFLARKSFLFFEKVKNTLEGMPGVNESIYRLKNAHYKLAIGTSLDKKYLNLVLDRLNVTDLFDVIVTGDQIKNGKPHPETYLTVAHKLGLSTSECVVLEDAQSGIQSAKAAGALCIAIKNYQAMDQDTNEADVTVASLNEVTLNLIDTLLP